jgi:hypothetical protein
LTTPSVAANDDPWARRRSTSSSGRLEAGKNCCGTNLNARSDAAKSATVASSTVVRCATHQWMIPRRRL